MLDMLCGSTPVKSVRELISDQSDHQCHLHLRHSSVEDSVAVQGAVMSINKQLINVGDYVTTVDPMVLICYCMYITFTHQITSSFPYRLSMVSC